ncbi:MAG: response regulator [Chloroflexus sp.]
MRTILIIDDDVAFTAKLKAQLSEAGYRVLNSMVLAHAERECTRERPDLVLLEVRTEHDAGWEALPRLAAFQPVIVLSSAGLEEDVMRGFAAGAADYITKPYRTGELLARIQARMLPEAPVIAPTNPKTTVIEETTPVSTNRRTNGEEATEPVFMSEAEELALLRQSEQAPIRQLSESEQHASLGHRLRAERQRRHLTLVQIENDIKVRMYYLQAIEDEQWSLLPRGPAALRMIRTYAGYFGIDSSAAETEYRSRYQVEEKTPSFSFTVGNVNTRLPRRSPPRWLIVTLAIVLALAIAGGAIYYFDPAFFSQFIGG